MYTYNFYAPVNNYYYPTKTCSKCREEKSYECFSKNKSSLDGYQAMCKRCFGNYYSNNKSYMIQQQGEYKRYRREHDPEFRLIEALRGRLSYALKTGHPYHVMKTMGCSTTWLSLWLGTTKNYYAPYSNKTHVDHFTPLSRCDLSTPEGQMYSNSWWNIRIIDAHENLVKHATLPTEEEVQFHNDLIMRFLEWMRCYHPSITY